MLFRERLDVFGGFADEKLNGRRLYRILYMMFRDTVEL
jgi:hypothetical protein